MNGDSINEIQTMNTIKNSSGKIISYEKDGDSSSESHLLDILQGDCLINYELNINCTIIDCFKHLSHDSNLHNIVRATRTNIKLHEINFNVAKQRRNC